MLGILVLSASISKLILKNYYINRANIVFGLAIIVINKYCEYHQLSDEQNFV